MCSPSRLGSAHVFEHRCVIRRAPREDGAAALALDVGVERGRHGCLGRAALAVDQAALQGRPEGCHDTLHVFWLPQQCMADFLQVPEWLM